MSRLHAERLKAVREEVRASGARSVLDLGCGDGELLMRLAKDAKIERVVGIDICTDSLTRLRRRLDSEDIHGGARIDLIHGSMTDRMEALAGFDCAVLIETIEHIDPADLSQLERTVFATLRPKTVVITTPNAEFNRLLGVPPHRFRHPDHRFEWDRARFQRWVNGVAGRNGFNVTCHTIAGSHPVLGGSSQMAVFKIFHRPGEKIAA